MQNPPQGIEFGCNPRTLTKFGDGTFPMREKRWKLIPRNLWQPCSMSHCVPMIYSQLDGMCTSNAACMAMMIERVMRNRRHNPVLSPEHLYGQHSRWGSGSSLDENLIALISTGVCDRKTIGPNDWQPSTWPDDAEEKSLENKLLEAVDLEPDFDAVATALQRFHPTVIGVRWPGGGGHAVCATELDRDGGRWVLRGPNSWSEDWGDAPKLSSLQRAWRVSRKMPELAGGFWQLTEKECRDFSTYGCFAIGTST